MTARQLELHAARVRLETLGAHTSRLPVHLADQLQAAARDQRAQFEQLARAPIFSHGCRGNGDDPAAVLLFDRYVIRPALEGLVEVCRHLTSPAPVWVLASQPGAFWCDRCWPTQALAADLDPGYLAAGCDLCGDTSGIYQPAVVTMTTTTLLAHICTRCVG